MDAVGPFCLGRIKQEVQLVSQELEAMHGRLRAMTQGKKSQEGALQSLSERRWARTRVGITTGSLDTFTRLG